MVWVPLFGSPNPTPFPLTPPVQFSGGRSDREAFYQGGFLEFSNEEFGDAWWPLFFFTDRDVFIAEFLTPIGDEAISTILKASEDCQFLTYLKLFGLNLDLIFGDSKPNDERTYGSYITRQIEFFEFMDVGLSCGDVADFLAENFESEQIQLCAKETVPLKESSLYQDVLLERPEAMIARIDFAGFSESPEQVQVLRKLGDVFCFKEKLGRLQEKFEALQRDI